MMRLSLLAFLATALAHMRRQTPHKAKLSLNSYTFDHFIQDFGRSYKPGTEEYRNRLALFQVSLNRIHEVNTQNKMENSGWTSGIHPFMDWSKEERKVMNGYKPSRNPHRMTALQTTSNLRSNSALKAKARSNTTMKFETDFSWELSGMPIRQQGSCGSCWAIASVEAAEAQLLKDGTNVRLSAQALVDCVPNPKHCGGTGGCDGATGELAYQYMMDHGIPVESEVPYTAQTGSCENTNSGGAWSSNKRVMVSGWNALPSNKLQPLQQAVTTEGPTVVSVDANNWFDYTSGIFDGCDRDAVLGHAVLLVGYGQENGKDYWRIQNSWGADWGEAGHIRLIKHADEEGYCGTDRKPAEGSGCDGGPSEITVCGTCGILYEPLVPEGVRVDDGAPGAPPAIWHPPKDEFKEFEMPKDDQAAAQPDQAAAQPDQAAAQADGPTKKMQSLLDQYEQI
jgi:cathepsin L